MFLISCELPKRYNDVHIIITFEEAYIDTIETDVNFIDIYKDRIEANKWILDEKGDGHLVALVLKKDEYESLDIKQINKND